MGPSPSSTSRSRQLMAGLAVSINGWIWVSTKGEAIVRHVHLSTTQGRAVLQRIIRGRLTFTPRADGQGYDFAAATRFDKLFTGIVAPRPAWIPVGQANIGVNDTLDRDYGSRLPR
jgi:hypothetical protein